MSIKARFPGRCPRCGEDIAKGSYVESTEDGWVHAECPAPVTNAEDWPQDAWEHSDTPQDHADHGGFGRMTRDGIEYLICFRCEKEMPRHGFPVKPDPDGPVGDYPDYPAREPRGGYGEHLTGDDPWN